MESSLSCKVHGKPVQTICLSCKELMCYKCNAAHLSRGCKAPLDLPSYATQLVMPKLKLRLEQLDKQRSAIDSCAEALATSLLGMRNELMALRAKTERLLGQLDGMLEALGDETFTYRSPYGEMQEALFAQQKELITAIESEDMSYIVQVLQNIDRPDPHGVGEADEQLFQDTAALIANILAAQQLDSLNDNLQTLTATCQKVLRRQDGVAPVLTQFVYGVCNPVGARTKLCRYDTVTMQLTPCIKVPQYCSVLQMARRIFLCGGYNPVVNTAFEYFEEKVALAPRTPMHFARCHHSLIAITTTDFACIAGYNTSSLAHCEEYSIVENCWKKLPSLNQPKCGCGAVLFEARRELYTIGGHGSHDSVEMLNLHDKKTWIQVTISLCEVPLSVFGVAAFAISSEECIILASGDTPVAGIYNIKAGKIKKHPHSLIPDSYSHNAVCTIGHNVYAFGRSGHLHIYKSANETFEEIKYTKP